MRKNELTEFGKIVKIELIKRNMTLTDLAEMTGINIKRISDVMVGRSHNQSHVNSIREALGMMEMEV